MKVNVVGELPRIGGRAPRVALLVYNDAHNDSRVLKTAASLRSAGAHVRIFAVARRRSGHGEGGGVVGEGIDVERAPEFELVRYAPWALRIARRLTGRPSPDAAVAPAPVTGGWATSGPAALPVSTAQRIFTDVWLRTYRTLSLSLYWLHTARAASAWGPDVIHANDANTLAPALWVARATGAQIVYDSHELWLHRNVRQDRPVAPWVEAAIEAWGIRRAAGVITVSPSIVTWLGDHYRLDRSPTLVRNAPRHTPPGQGRLREMAGLGTSDRVVAYGGRITTSRGIEETLAAIALLPPDVHFALLGYGEPDYLARLRTVVEALALTSRVHFVGAVGSDQVSAALADADVSVVFVRPICLSYTFSLPNKVFESIHAGVPVVAADLPDTAALVREHGVGEIFASENLADIADTIEAVLDDPDRYRERARWAAATLTWEHEEAALLDLYSGVLAGDPASGDVAQR